MSKSTPSNGAPSIRQSSFSPAGTVSAVPAMVRPELVQKHLEQVLVSAEMCRSKKLCQFLRFTVEEVLRGHGSELKEYAIAVGVFRRPREFDPATDPIVRVQARRLRSKLRRYYQNEGRAEPIQIEYPVGGYSPLFLQRTPSATTAQPGIQAMPPREGLHSPCVAVLPFTGLGPEECQSFSDGLTDELIHRLSASPGLSVAARTSSLQFKGEPGDVRRIAELLGVSALISGSVRKEGSNLRVLVQLIDAVSGMNLCSMGYGYPEELGGVLETQEKISQQVAEVLQSYLSRRDSAPSRNGRSPRQPRIH